MSDKRELFEMDDAELYTEIGKALVIDEMGFLPSNLKGIEERGRRWVSAQHVRIHSAVCSNRGVRAVSENGFTPELVSAVSGAIESVITGTALTPLAVLLCRQGIRVFCKSEWEAKE